MYPPQFDEQAKETLLLAVKALEEIKQYRALGTVEELRVAKEFYDSINKIEDDICRLGMGCDDLRERIKQIYKQFRGKV